MSSFGSQAGRMARPTEDLWRVQYGQTSYSAERLGQRRGLLAFSLHLIPSSMVSHFDWK